MRSPALNTSHVAKIENSPARRLSIYTGKVSLPSALHHAIEDELSGLDRGGIARAVEVISSGYRAGRYFDTLATPEARAAYLVTRVPATYAACEFVFEEFVRLLPRFTPRSLLDLGAGPGTASWAAAEQWQSLAQFAMIERNRDFASIGQRLTSHSVRLQSAMWHVADLSKADFPSSDLVVLSYAVSELPDALTIVSAAWKAARELLVIVEPGTPRHFARMAGIRRELLSAGGRLLAPCPHENECPMIGANDWCHFAVRLQRTSEHRRMKSGALGYEDEKFSYLVFSKSAVPDVNARIVRHPVTRSGFIQLSLCTSEGLRQRTVTRSQKEQFRAARRARWGDEWPYVE